MPREPPRRPAGRLPRSLSRAVLRLGGLLIPVSLGLTLTVYALSFAFAAVSVAVLGHETRDEALADTVAEEEGEPVYRGGRFVRTPAERPLTTTR